VEGTGVGFLIRLILNGIALIVVAYVVPGVGVTGIDGLPPFVGAIVAGTILGFVNAIVRPILVILSLPLQIVTLGLFTLVINALLFWFVGALHIGLVVHGFWAAFWGAIILWIVSWILSALTRGVERA
jgi:putative membrane protein